MFYLLARIHKTSVPSTSKTAIQDMRDSDDAEIFSKEKNKDIYESPSGTRLHILKSVLHSPQNELGKV